MKKRIWMIVAAAAMMITACQQAEMEAEADTDTAEPVVLTLANNLPSDSCTSAAIEWFADQVEERSDGRIHIEVYNDSALGDSFSCLEQLQYGSIDMVKTDVSVMTNYVPEFHAFVMPYVYEDTEHFRKVHGGDIGMAVLRGESMEKLHMYGLTYYDGGARCFYSKKPVYGPSDMEGMLVRVQESRLMMSMVEELGGIPVVLEYGDVYAALQEGAVSAAENSMVNYLEQGYERVAPYFVEDAHTRNADMLVMSEVSRGKLEEKDLEMIDETALESWAYQQKLWDEAEVKARQEMEKRQVTIIVPTDEQLLAFRKACEPIWSAYESGAYLDVIDRIVAAGRM
ncbi:TRAP transporter substrate-binding protein DctP [Clostridium sp. AN503]|uniref:TRAP transporter substrate-binding protein DctP n=1 Tax=Clostridium sp. AN503 TaxID=3160598 RepID=UPI00345B30A0